MHVMKSSFAIFNQFNLSWVNSKQLIYSTYHFKLKDLKSEQVVFISSDNKNYKFKLNKFKHLKINE